MVVIQHAAQLAIPGTDQGAPVLRSVTSRPGRPALCARPDASDRRSAGEGERACIDCRHCDMDDRRGVEKCALTRTPGTVTDIAASDAACSRFAFVWEG